MLLAPRKRLIDDPGVRIAPVRPGALHWTLVGAAICLFAWLYVWLALVLLRTTNQDPLAQDQKHNMRLALQTRPTLEPDLREGILGAFVQWLPQVTDGVVAPLWPWIAAHVARDGHTIEEATFTTHSVTDLFFFQRGKWVNLALCGAFLLVATLAVARRWTVLGTVNFMLLSGLGALLPRAVAFQPDPLYFILFFLCWVVGMGLCARNPLGMYACFGLVCGLAYLTKSSIQPLMGVWFGATALRFILALFRPDDRWSATRHVIGVMMMVAVFFVVIAPRLCHAQERWGRPFFAYPNVWMWMDDFDAAYRWMGEHPDRAALDAVPAAAMPSPAVFRATHTRDQMWSRLRDGMGEKVGRFIAPKRAGRNGGTEEKPWKNILEWRGAYLGGAALIGVLTWALSRGRSDPRPVAEPPVWPAALCQGLFVAGVVSVSAVLYGWYSLIGRGDRFMLSLFIPMVFSVLLVAELAVRRADAGARGGLGRVRWVCAAGHAVLLGALLYRVGEVVTHPHFDPVLR